MLEGQIGPFTIVRRIFAGTRTEVYVARRRGPGGFSRLVALKRVVPDADADDRAVRSLLDEAHIQGLITHPNVVQVHDLLSIDGEYLVAMDWVDGTNLSGVIKRCLEKGGPLPYQHALLIAREVARGLQAAHVATDDTGSPLHLVHRDVNPKNILIGWDGSVRLTDFGVARAARRLSQTRANAIKGTPGYMSPEQAAGATDVDPRSDIYALGLTLHVMLTGKHPLRGGSAEELILEAREVVIGPPSATLPSLPAELDTLVGSCTARLPRLRFPDARTAEIALSRGLHHADPDYSGADLTGFLRAIFPETVTASDSESTDVYSRKG